MIREGRQGERALSVWLVPPLSELVLTCRTISTPRNEVDAHLTLTKELGRLLDLPIDDEVREMGEDLL